MSEYEEDERNRWLGEALVRGLEAMSLAYGRKLALVRVMLHLETADGATRIFYWQGRPPDVLEVPMRTRRVAFVVPGATFEHAPMPVRRYEYRSQLSATEYRYTEIVDS